MIEPLPPEVEAALPPEVEVVFFRHRVKILRTIVALAGILLVLMGITVVVLLIDVANNTTSLQQNRASRLLACQLNNYRRTAALRTDHLDTADLLVLNAALPYRNCARIVGPRP